MRVRALIVVEHATYDQWRDFYDSYEVERSNFVSDEVIQKTSEHEAIVSFDIRDLDALTALTARPEIRLKEEELGIVTTIL
jgi:hypothetical protein